MAYATNAQPLYDTLGRSEPERTESRRAARSHLRSRCANGVHGGRALLFAQGNDGIDAHRSSSGNVAGEQRDCAKSERDNGEGQRIGRLDAE